MKAKMVVVFIVLGLTLLSGGLRFYHLGDWPFFGDEVATLHEVESLWGIAQTDLHTQIVKLPRMIPLAHTLHYVGYQLFGWDEFGSRVLPAILGTLMVPLVFLLLDGLVHRPSALATALLLAARPDHVNRSQENRFYMPAAFFTALCVLLGGWALKRRSAPLTVLACLAAFAAILSHTLTGVLLVGLFVALTLPQWASPYRVCWRLPAAVGGASLAVAVFGVLYLYPLARGWNHWETWGSSPGYALFTSISLTGWPVVVLACLGGLMVLRDRSEQGLYWLLWAGLWVAACLVLPFLVVFHAGYVFPLTLGVFVLAGFAVGRVFDALRERGAVPAWGWVGCACALALPSLVSHYCDGSRWDYRSAARHISRHWQEGDQVAAFRPGTLDVYLEAPEPTVWLPPSDPVPRLEELRQSTERFWIVLPSGRAGLPPRIRRWLGKHCSGELEIRRPRYDHTQHVVEVFLYDATERTASRLVKAE